MIGTLFEVLLRNAGDAKRMERLHIDYGFSNLCAICFDQEKSRQYISRRTQSKSSGTRSVYQQKLRCSIQDQTWNKENGWELLIM
mgnify:CR=1 FL=1